MNFFKTKAFHFDHKGLHTLHTYTQRNKALKYDLVEWKVGD